MIAPADPAHRETAKRRDLFLIALKIGLLSFGGPAAQIALMHREFVENRGWLTEDRFLRALNFCMLLPGPEAQQLATYCGWLVGKTIGGLIAGLLFILPGALAMLAVSVIYVTYGNVGFVAALFYGLKGGVLAIVVQALLRLGSKALTTTRLRTIALVAFLALFILKLPFPVVILAAGLFGYLSARGPSHAAAREPNPSSGNEATRPRRVARVLVSGILLWGLPVACAAWVLTPSHALVTIAGFFSTLALVSFGGAYALLSYMAQVAVNTMQWLSPGEMLDGLGLAETTPGPLILVTQFVGFLAGYRNAFPLNDLLGGVLGAALTTWVTFAPSFLFVLIGAPFMERLQDRPGLSAALSSITAAVAGTILNLAVWFALNVLFNDVREETILGVLHFPVPQMDTLDPALAAIAAVALILTFVARLGLAVILPVCCGLGLLAQAF